MVLNVPLSMLALEADFLETTVEPKGHKVRRPMLKVAKAHGIPIIVKNNKTPANIQDIAETNPPKINQITFNRTFICKITPIIILILI